MPQRGEGRAQLADSQNQYLSDLSRLQCRPVDNANDSARWRCRTDEGSGRRLKISVHVVVRCCGGGSGHQHVLAFPSARLFWACERSGNKVAAGTYAREQYGSTMAGTVAHFTTKYDNNSTDRRQGVVGSFQQTPYTGLLFPRGSEEAGRAWCEPKQEHYVLDHVKNK